MLILVTGMLLPITGFFVPDGIPFFITHAYAQDNTQRKSTGKNRQKDKSKEDEEQADSIKNRKPRYSVRRTTTETTEDVRHRSTDLKDPDNLKSEVTYDDKSDTYNIGTVLSKNTKKDKDDKKKTNKGQTNKSGSSKDNDKHATNVKLGSFLPANTLGLNLSTATDYLTPPVTMTTQEYMDWSHRQSMSQY